jgi:hypothetical protein
MRYIVFKFRRNKIMATWGIHLRIAEGLLKRGYDLDYEKFLIGNIGPDCGTPYRNRTVFDPPAEVTHWSNSDKTNIFEERFYQAYLADREGDKEKRSFLIGYYTHLITDKEWHKVIERKKRKDPLYSPLKKDGKFISVIKKDFYDLDHLYYREHPDSLFFTHFQFIKDFPNYLHYYKRGAISGQIEFITNFYLNPPEDLNREYLYMSLGEMEDFVDKTIFYLEMILEQKNLVYSAVAV